MIVKNFALAHLHTAALNQHTGTITIVLAVGDPETGHDSLGQRHIVHRNDPAGITTINGDNTTRFRPYQILPVNTGIYPNFRTGYRRI